VFPESLCTPSSSVSTSDRRPLRDHHCLRDLTYNQALRTLARRAGAGKPGFLRGSGKRAVFVLHVLDAVVIRVESRLGKVLAAPIMAQIFCRLLPDD